MKAHKVWCFTPHKASKDKVPENVKAEVEMKAKELVDSFLKPKYIQTVPNHGCFIYTADIYTKWYRSYFYFCSKDLYCVEDTTSAVLETKFARLEYAGNGLFNLSYMRHTGKWLEIYTDISLEECLAAVKDEPHFLP